MKETAALLQGAPQPQAAPEHQAPQAEKPETKKQRLARYRAERKALESGHCSIIKADAYYPSTQKCSSCDTHYKVSAGKNLPLGTTEWTCQACGVHHHRDINAAENLRLHAVNMLDSMGEEVFVGGCLIPSDPVRSIGATRDPREAIEQIFDEAEAAIAAAALAA